MPFPRERAAMTRRQMFRQLMSDQRGLVVPGAYDGVSAKLVERAGFPVVYMTGYGVSASRLGMPDMGFAGLAEMADQARNMAAAVSIPLIADADTGYGNALNVRRTVSAYEAGGVAGLHLEDQELPKRCGHLAGKRVVPAEEFAAKIRAAVETRTDPDLVIIARTDAIAVNGFDDALRRAELAVKAGADMLFVEAPTTEEQIERVARAFDTPLLFNYAPGGRSPLVALRAVARAGLCPDPAPRGHALRRGARDAGVPRRPQGWWRGAAAGRAVHSVPGVQRADRSHGADRARGAVLGMSVRLGALVGLDPAHDGLHRRGRPGLAAR